MTQAIITRKIELVARLSLLGNTINVKRNQIGYMAIFHELRIGPSFEADCLAQLEKSNHGLTAKYKAIIEQYN